MRQRVTYVDEGSGEVVLFVYGNPPSSFEHRRLLRHLSAEARPGYWYVAVDHLGFGLSDRLEDVSYPAAVPRRHPGPRRRSRRR